MRGKSTFSPKIAHVWRNTEAILVDFWDWAEKITIAGGVGLALGMWAKIVVRWLS